jgi:hypothetical protein
MWPFNLPLHSFILPAGDAENQHKRAKRSASMDVSPGSGGSSAAYVSACAQCGTKAERDRRLMKCGRCRDVHYCSKECQMRHWNVHRKWCDDPHEARAIEARAMLMMGTNTL